MVFAISTTEAPGSLEMLIRAARGHDDPEIRSKALFWLAQQAGDRAEETLRGAIEDDPELEVKEQAVFALSQLPAEGPTSAGLL